MVFFENVWWLLVMIGVMILIHELGHFWAARFFDVKVEAFSFGFGPRLFGFKRGETDFRFSAILFGGYVKMAGEQPGVEVVGDRLELGVQAGEAVADEFDLLRGHDLILPSTRSGLHGPGHRPIGRDG